MSDQLKVFSEYGNRFADKYGDQLGELAGAGAVIMGLMAEILKCECGGMRMPVTITHKWDKPEELYHCKSCDGWWRFNAGVKDDEKTYQMSLFPTNKREES